jgi:hypothetical protein
MHIGRVRLLSAIVLAFMTCPVAVADDSGAIEWSQERRLIWNDFAGSVPSGTDEIRVAETSASLAWSYEYTLEWSRDRCVFSIVDISASALFHPGNSWVRPGHRTDPVLLHEQGHFDITQLYRERFAARTREFLGAERNCRGRNERAAARSVESEIAQTLGSAYKEIWRNYRREQERYDAETRHGIDSSAQAAWSERISNSLSSAIPR